jgi:GNAT superfamily N-acetyltransferase
MIQIQQLPARDIGRLGEIDRSERVWVVYSWRDGDLHTEAVDWQVPAWTAEGEGPHSLHGMIRCCAQELARSGVLLGALDGNRLVGVAVLRFHLTSEMAQLAFLHVSRPCRRQGIAAQLTGEAVRLARQDGAWALYVSATPSESAVGFYLSQGFWPTDEPDPELFALEPEDIHLIKMLSGREENQR